MKEKDFRRVEGDPEMERLLFRYLMGHTSDMVYFKDRESRFLVVSQAHADWCGLKSPHDVVGKTDFDLFADEHARQAYEDEQRIIATGEPIINVEEKETWPDGRITWVSTSKMPLFDDNRRVIGTFGISRDITRQKQLVEEVVRREQQLREKNDILEADLERARIIQAAFLPPGPPRIQGLQVDYRHMPLEAVSGDFFSFYPQPGGGLGVFVGDLCGHGVSAALFMALVKFIADELAVPYGHEPAAFLIRLNEKLMDRMPFAFITAIYGCWRPARGGSPARFRFVNAGHPRPVLVRKGGSVIELPDASCNAAVGVLRDFEANELEIELHPGDRLYFYTDGLAEARSAATGELGDDAVVDQVRRCGSLPLGQSLDAILQVLGSGDDRHTPEDDVLLVVLEAQ